MTATPEILSMSPTRIEKEEAENQPLLLDSGAPQQVYIKHDKPTEYRNQGTGSQSLTAVK